MEHYYNQSGKLKKVKETPFKLERDIQKIFEANLETLMGLELVKSEFTIKDKRIDTLAYDNQNNAFIIIEYKRDKNHSVVDQGFTYLSLMLENKADFILQYMESMKRPLKREDIDWSQTRVAFVSTSFTENQIQATNFKDIAIELWEVRQFENSTITINPIKKSASAESIKPLAQKNGMFKSVTEEIKVYTEQERLKNASELTARLYESFKNAILNLSDGIEIEAKKVYIAFRKGKNILDIVVNNKNLKIVILARSIKLDDPKNIAYHDSENKERWGNGSYIIKEVVNDNDLEYIMSLIKQVIIKQ